MFTKSDIKFVYPTVQYFLDGVYQFDIDNEIEMNNIRLWVVQNAHHERIHFKFNEHIIKIDHRGGLSAYPKGMYDQDTRQMAQLVRLNRSKTIC
jgi:predicted ATPase